MNYHQILDLLKELNPKLRHKPEEVLDTVISLRLIQADFFLEYIEPREATRILSSDIPRIVDDLLSLKQILGYLQKDVDKALIDIGKKLADEPNNFPGFEIKELQIYARNYRNSIKKLRRKTKAEVEYMKLQHEAEEWEKIGLGKLVEDWFVNEDSVDNKLLNALHESGVYYDFQLIFISLTQFIKNTPGLGKKCLARINGVVELFVDVIGEQDIPEISKKRESIYSTERLQ